MISTLFLVVLGLCAGNLMNMVAINVLAGRSWLSFGLHCEKCDHELGFADQIPLLSFLMSGGRCRYCKQLISWLFILVELAAATMLVVFVNKWGPSWYLTGMLVLGCTLLIVTVTDLIERLIPHDITYPSMLCGIIFSTFIRHDLEGALIGVGISYILFDFFGHYGQKIYSTFSSVSTDSSTHKPEVEVLGGADAVLAAVIAAWLGWMELFTALFVSFIIGSIMAIWFALHRAYKLGEPQKVAHAGLVGAIIGAFVLVIPIALMGSMIGNITVLIGIAVLIGAVFGYACGVISAGPRESMPFPFGPALAAGGFVAMFYHATYTLPKWLF